MTGISSTSARAWVSNAHLQPNKLYFGTTSQQERPESPPEVIPGKFSDLKDKPDPAPRRTFSLRNAMIAIAGVLGFWYGESAVQQVHQAAAARVVQTASNEAPASTSSKLLDGLAQVDHTLYNAPVIGTVENLYTTLVSWEALTLAWVAAMATYRKRIRPSELFSELNTRGLTGKGMKVGVIDTGGVLTGTLNRENTQFSTPGEPQNNQPYDPVGHGTGVAQIIAEANPEAQFLIMRAGSSDNYQQIEDDFEALYKQAQENPKALTPMALRKVYKPLIQNIAANVRKAADEGCQVVNLSMSLEQGVMIRNMFKFLGALMPMALVMLKSRVLKEGSEAYERNQDKGEKLFPYIDQLQSISRANESTETISKELVELYQPWLEALDYAHQKGMAVVVASGNSGGHEAFNGKSLGNINPFAMVEHPALITVGSTDSEGTISKFTSEFNEQVTPWIAGNGSGELSTRGATAKRSWWKKVLFPLGSNPSLLQPFVGLMGRLKMNNPEGTSFGAPNIAALYVKMKELDPTLSVEEAKAIMAECAAKAKFSPKQQTQIETEIRARIARTISSNHTRQLENTFFDAAQKALQAAPNAIIAETPTGLVTVQVENHQVTFQLPKTESETEAKIKTKYSFPQSLFEKTLADMSESRAHMPFANLMLVLTDTMPPTPITPEMIEKELQGEIKRRVGHGTLANRHHQTLYLTEQKKLAKAQKETHTTPNENVQLQAGS